MGIHEASVPLCIYVCVHATVCAAVYDELDQRIWVRVAHSLPNMTQERIAFVFRWFFVLFFFSFFFFSCNVF